MSLKIVIIGVGEVGFNLAKSLSKEDYDITIIDVSPKKCDRIRNTIDARVIEGDGASQRILQKIENMHEIDYLLALTRIDEVNLVASQIARDLGAKKVICRLRNAEYTHKNAVVKPSQFGIDFVTYPEKAAQKEIEKLIRQSSAVEVQEFSEENIKLVGIELETSSPLIGRSVKNVEISNPYIPHKLAVILRGEESFVPHQETIYQKNDFVYFVGKSNDIPKIQQMAGKPAFKVKNVVILGAGKIGRLLAKSLRADFDVRVIEKDKEKITKYSPSMPDVLFLNGDGMDIEYLEAENISDVDCFIAATAEEQKNILASLIVKHFGVKQVILHITTSNYLKSVRRIGIDAVVSKNISAVNEVLKVIHSDQQDLPISRFEDILIDAVEIAIKPNCKYIRKKYSLEKIPENMCLGAIIRDGSVKIPNSHTELKVGDQLLIFTKPDCIDKAEDLFKSKS